MSNPHIQSKAQMRDPSRMRVRRNARARAHDDPESMEYDHDWTMADCRKMLLKWTCNGNDYDVLTDDPE